MRQTILRAASVVILSLSSIWFVALAGSATPAHAASSNGAQHVHSSVCTVNIRTGILECFTEDYVQNDTVTPSGHESYHAHGTVTVVESLDGALLSSQTQTFNYHILRKDGLIQELGSHTSLTLTQHGTTCTETFALHYANSQMQFDRESSTC